MCKSTIYTIFFILLNWYGTRWTRYFKEYVYTFSHPKCAKGTPFFTHNCPRRGRFE